MALSYTGQNVRICRVCGCDRSRVKDVRATVTQDVLKRWRRCPECGRCWTTVEIMETDYDKYVAPNYPPPKGRAGHEEEDSF